MIVIIIRQILKMYIYIYFFRDVDSVANLIGQDTSWLVAHAQTI